MKVGKNESSMRTVALVVFLFPVVISLFLGTFVMAEVLEKPELARLAVGLPKNIKEFRIVKIGDVDTQVDGGTHVKNLQEIGKIEITKTVNKGKNNRRIYFVLK